MFELLLKPKVRLYDQLVACGPTGVWQSGIRTYHIPSDLKKGLVVSIWKGKGGRQHSNIYRSILQFSVCQTMYLPMFCLLPTAGVAETWNHGCTLPGVVRGHGWGPWSLLGTLWTKEIFVASFVHTFT